MSSCLIIRPLNSSKVDILLKQVSQTNQNTNWEYLGKEYSSFTLDKDTLCRFGYSPSWDYKILKPGTYKIERVSFYNTDPAYGKDKVAYKYTGEL